MKLMQQLALTCVRTKFSLLSLLSKKNAAKKALDFFCTPQSRTNKLPSKIFNEAEKLKFELNGLWIHGYRWNHQKDKKVLIVHGFESSITNFDHFVAPLIEKDYEVLAFDAPGHGLSDGTKITAPLFASMLVTIHENYGPIQSFMTHSFGGLAISLALEQIGHDESYRVVLIAPATESETAIQQFFHLMHLNGDVRREFDKLITEIGGHPGEWYSVPRAIKNIKAQILWLHDEDDLQTPLRDALKVKNENLPNVTFVITRGLGHSKIYRDPEVAKTIIDFL